MELSEIEKALAPMLEAESVELVDLKYAKEGPKWVLRVFLDKQGGITLDDCAYFSDRIGGLIDSGNLIQRSYLLEVSSPGLDRVVKTEADFVRFSGKWARLRLKFAAGDPAGGQRNFQGKLRGWREGKALMEVDGQAREFAREAIEEVRLDYAAESAHAKGE